MLLDAEGVKRIIVVSSDPLQYGPEAKWATGVEVWERDRLDEAQRVLREIDGITALIYDQPCATELRRQRSRGLVPDAPLRVFINEAVCEGCGDCGVKSNCLSVFPVETEFGRKTQIHQSSCNRDYTCLEGDCPAFVTVLPATNDEANKERKFYRVEQDLAEPARKVPESCNIYMMGIGGSGVVTANQVLGTAALLDGKHVRSLDQTGLSQKGGPVVSNLKIFEQPTAASNIVSVGEADAYIVFDMLTGTTDVNLSRARPDKTVAAVSGSLIPTGSMVSSTAISFPSDHHLKRRIEARTRVEDNVYLDAIALAENLFGSHMPANIITLGAAYQGGLIPLSSDSIERAITLNGVAVESNIHAFRVGRLLVADPEWRQSVQPKRPGALTIASDLSPQARELIDEVGAEGALKRLLESRVPELIAYQDVDYARQYVEFVRQITQAERAAVPDQSRLSQAVARYLFKLMAYKDEYEVARLYLKPEVGQAITEQFGRGAEMTYHLHPPFLRYLGMKKKMRLGKWFDGLFRLLVVMRRLRGTPLDLFGRAGLRRVERALIDEYRALIEEALSDLSQPGYERAVKLARLPDLIRGYEEIKLANVQRFREEVANIKAASQAGEGRKAAVAAD